MMSQAAEESTRSGHGFLGVEHLFMALAETREDQLADAFESQKLELPVFTEQLRSRIEPLEHSPWGSEILVTPRCQQVLRLAAKIAVRNRKPQISDEHILDAIFREGRSVPIRLLRTQDVQVAELYETFAPAPVKPSDAEHPLLARFGRDLTAQAQDGALMPVIGREKEMTQLAEVLLRKRKNNPVLVGEAGVGKTAVVEGLANHLLDQDEGHPFRGCRIIELSVASLVAGTKYRGDFEERILGILKEASSDPDVILFLDEIHTLVGAGSSSGEAVGASEIVKPALARGDLRCIGATTIEEYRRHIERDSALERRFEPVMIEEPTPSETKLVLQGLAPSLELHHGVEIAPEAIEAAVELTVRYVPGRRLPDKAIDALDQCGARIRLRTLSAGRGESSPTRTVDRESVACTVSQWTGIPLERLSGEDVGHLLELEEQLRSRVLGQDHACSAIARAVMTSKAGLSDPERPSGVFLFLGPTGVGKTELAKSLAHHLFGDEKRLVRFDMSEYMEPHSVAKLIGAPPGYVGHEQEGQLVAAVRTHPHCVVLFDENLQIRPTEAPKTLGFAAQAAAPEPPVEPRELLTGYFRPELVNRIDEILVFNSLGETELRLIIDRYVQDLERLAAARELRIELTEEVYEFLIAHGVSEQFGARELRRVIDRYVRQPLAEELIRRGDSASLIRLTFSDNQIRFE
jgi:ATP-dependent Clp protease ATP-binding subunit ClpC